MEELTIEQKAKAYDVAIEGLRNAFYNDKNRMCEEYREAVIKVIEPLFPELKESEDDKIRQLLIRFVTHHMGDNYSDNFSKEECLAWLEKAVTPTLQDWNDYKDKPGELWNAYGKGIANGIERGKASVKNHPQDYGLEKQNRDNDIDTILDKVNIKSYKEGDVWCILYGENVDEGICGYGNTKEDAFMDFLTNLLEESGQKQKSTLSKEDKNIIDRLLSLCEEAQDNFPQLSAEFSDIEELKDWLKSIECRIK